MDGKSYTATLMVAVPPTAVFNCINAVSKWWTTDFDGENARAGDELVICHPGAHCSKQRVEEFVPAKKVVWLVTESQLDWLKNNKSEWTGTESQLDWLKNNKSEWTGTRMIFELSGYDDKTTVRFTHQGLTPEKECYARCSEGWDLVIKTHLFDFINTGKTI